MKTQIKKSIYLNQIANVSLTLLPNDLNIINLVTFKTQNFYHRKQYKGLGCLNEATNITTFNIPFGIVMEYLSKPDKQFYKGILLGMAPSWWKSIFVTRTAGELIWGYEVNLYTVIYSVVTNLI